MKILKKLIDHYPLKMISFLLTSVMIVSIILILPTGWRDEVVSEEKQMSVEANSETPPAQFAPVTITTGKLTISGGGIPMPAQPPFQPVTIETGMLTISGGGVPLPPSPPFPPVTITTAKLTISGKPNE